MESKETMDTDNKEDNKEDNREDNRGDREIVPIELWTSQISHYQRTCEIMKKSIGFLDTSEMGSGKTVTTLALCATFNLKLGVVGPLSVLSMWEEMSDYYGIRLGFVISYQKLAGTKTNGCNNLLLHREQDIFSPTKYLEDLIKEGTLFIFDEAHYLKNSDTAQLNAGHCITKTVRKMNCGSRIGLLTATPCDKKEHVQSLLKMLGIIYSTDLYNYDKRKDKYSPVGIKELYDYGKTIDSQMTDDIYAPISLNRTSVNKLCHDMYMGIIKKHMVSSMKKPIINIEKDAKNGFYEMSRKDIELIHRSELLLRKATYFDEKTGTTNIKKGSWFKITEAQMGLEEAKLDTLVRLTKKTLEENSNNKVIIYVWYVDENKVNSIKILEKKLKKYGPLILYGKTSQKDRNNIRNLFQQDNNDHRLIIANPKAGGIGISLDDRSGNRPRFLYMIPSYNFIEMEQATGRIVRGTTKSKATIRFIYSKSFTLETSILGAISRKSEIVKSMLYDSENVIFPGDYPSYIEEDVLHIPIEERKNKKLDNKELKTMMRGKEEIIK